MNKFLCYYLAIGMILGYCVELKLSDELKERLDLNLKPGEKGLIITFFWLPLVLVVLFGRRNN